MGGARVQFGGAGRGLQLEPAPAPARQRPCGVASLQRSSSAESQFELHATVAWFGKSRQANALTNSDIFSSPENGLATLGQLLIDKHSSTFHLCKLAVGFFLTAAIMGGWCYCLVFNKK